MSSGDSEPISPANPLVGSRSQDDSGPVAPVRSAWCVTLTLAAGLLSGLVAWGLGEVCLDRIKPPRHAVNSKGLVLNVTDRREVAVADARNAAVAYTFLGAALGAGLGMAGGLSRRSSVRSAANATLFGLVAGAATCAGLALVLLPLYNGYKARNPDEAVQDLLLPFLIHAAVWSSAGASAGVAFGMGLGDRRIVADLAMAGLVGAVLGTVGYELTGAILFPAAQTSRFVSLTWPTRLMARLAVTIFVAAAVALAATRPPKASRQP